MRRKDKQSSFKSTSVEVLMIKGKSSSKKGKGNHDRSKSRPSFRDLKKNQFAFSMELGHWKVDCSRIKDKKKESKTEANLAQVINIQTVTSLAGGSDSDSLVFSFSVTTLI